MPLGDRNVCVARFQAVDCGGQSQQASKFVCGLSVGSSHGRLAHQFFDTQRFAHGVFSVFVVNYVSQC